MPPALTPALEMAKGLLRKGGLVIAPTETFYAILGDAWSQKAISRLVKLKSWDYGKPVPLIAGSVRIIRDVTTDIPPIFDDLAREFWPGPLIMVLKAAKGFPPGVTAGTGNVGIRVPGWSVALELARIYGRPLTATGANFNGSPSPRATAEIHPEIKLGVDLTLDGGWTPGYQPPTILNLVPTPPVILRDGTLASRVTAFLNELSWRESRM